MVGGTVVAQRQRTTHITTGSRGLSPVSLTAVAAGDHPRFLQDRLRPRSSSGTRPTGLGADSGSVDPPRSSTCPGVLLRSDPLPVCGVSSFLASAGSVSSGCFYVCSSDQEVSAPALEALDPENKQTHLHSDGVAGCWKAAEPERPAAAAAAAAADLLVPHGGFLERLTFSIPGKIHKYPHGCLIIDLLTLLEAWSFMSDWLLVDLRLYRRVGQSGHSEISNIAAAQ
ncbi:uncharacterized protein LOC108166352 [Poecilia reticulata]|uniref:uncharacterized protein LOC108166352 n=1 Tax=Poecilia reticulata TaxID=8081 RepID=UPI0007EBB0CB|nr:PREDICTED: uncharacterized protein LOC108166352 [Poecilia reticulata]